MEKTLSGLFEQVAEKDREYFNLLNETVKAAFENRKVYELPFWKETKRLIDGGVFYVDEILQHYTAYTDDFADVQNLYIHKVEMRDDGLLWLTGVTRDPWDWDTDSYAPLFMQTMKTVLAFVKDVIKIEQQQIRTFADGEKVLIHVLNDNLENVDTWVTVVGQQNVTASSDRVKVSDGTKVFDTPAETLYKLDTSCECTENPSHLVCINHKVAYMEWYCADCKHMWSLS